MKYFRFDTSDIKPDCYVELKLPNQKILYGRVSGYGDFIYTTDGEM